VKKEPISVLIVDDSALMRNLVGKIIESTDDLVVAGKAMNGAFALKKLSRINPDVIILDLEMPEMDGIGFLKERKARGMDIPVVILSSKAKKGAKVTMEALSLGASDFILKPSGTGSEEIKEIAGQLIEIVRGYGLKYKNKKSLKVPHTIPETEVIPEQRRPAPPVEREERRPAPVEIIAIGISTGGPNALREVFSRIDGDLQVPIVIVQHMPPGFTGEFAKSLDRICALEVKEAEDGDVLKPGRVLIAPGDYHMEVEKRRLAGVVVLSSREPVNGHRPSVDVLFASVAKHYGNRTMAIIMTGMGKDGAEEIGMIRKMGGITIGQDAESCIVFGMPKVAIEKGHIQHVVSLKNMAEVISRLAKNRN